MVRWLTFLALSASMVIPALAWGTEIRPADLQFAGKSGGMGGTEVGLGNDPSSAWYNPSGLANLQQDSVSLGGSMLVHRNTEITPFLGSHLSSTGNTAFTGASISTFRLFGGRLAFAVLTPGDLSFRYDLTLGSASSHRDRTATDYLVGVAYGRHLTASLDWGAGIYYVYREARSSASDYRLYGTPQPSGLLELQVSQSEYSQGNGMLLVWGLTYAPERFDGRLRFGVAGRWGFNLYTANQSETTQFERTSTSDGFVRTQTGGRTHTPSPLPASLAVGVGYHPSDRWIVGFDLTFTGLSPIWDLAKQLEVLPTVNLSLGISREFSKSFSLQGGLFSNKASAVQSGSELSPSTWDEYGMTFGVLSNGENSHFSLGMRTAVLSSIGTVSLIKGETQAIAIRGYSIMVLLGSGYHF